jgi:hypothetical protein
MKMSPETGSAEAANERKCATLRWTRPEVRRLRAGDAETGGAATTDLGVTFS